MGIEDYFPWFKRAELSPLTVYLFEDRNVGFSIVVVDKNRRQVQSSKFILLEDAVAEAGRLFSHLIENNYKVFNNDVRLTEVYEKASIKRQR